METGFKRDDYYIRHIFSKYLFSSILAMLATSFAGLVDTVIVGHFLGETGLSAMSLVSPVYLIYYTVGAIVGIGGSIAGAMYVGRTNYDSYRNIFSLSTYILAITGVILTISGIALLSPVSKLFSDAGVIGTYAQEYLKWYILLGSFTLLVYSPLYFLKVDGKPQISSYLFLLSGVLNVVFSWLFMSPVCNMGIKGASIATGLSMGITSLTGLFVMLKGSKELRFVKCNTSELKRILKCGCPNGFNNLFTALKIMAFNAALIAAGGSKCLSSFAIIKNMSDLTTGIIVGISAAIMPIVGIFYGEKDNDSIRMVCRAAIKQGMVLTIVIAVLCGCFPNMWCTLFNVNDPESVSAVKSGLIFLSISLIPGFFNLVITGYSNAIRYSWLSSFILFFRLVLYAIPPAFILGRASGVSGVYSSLAVAEFLTLFTLFIIIGKIRSKDAKLDMYLLDTSAQGKGELSFSVRNNIDDIILASTQITGFCEEHNFDVKRTMKLSLCLEEMLTVIINYCMDKDKEQYIDIRIARIDEDVMIRIRNTGKIFDPVRFYEENKNYEDMMDQVLGIKMIVNSAKDISFHETFGTNNLMVLY